LPNVSSIEEMNEYLEPGTAPVVEAAAINGTGVTATLRAAVARILDNLKNNVDTTLREEPELAAPDMSAKSGVTSSSAGMPKLSMKTNEAPAPPAQQPTFVNPAASLEDDPFGGVAVAEPAVAVELQSLLTSARHMIGLLEAALERARAHEREIAEKLSRLQ